MGIFCHQNAKLGNFGNPEVKTTFRQATVLSVKRPAYAEMGKWAGHGFTFPTWMQRAGLAVL